METITYHCPTCGGELKLNVFSQRLMCDYCGQNYSPVTLAEQAEANNSFSNTTTQEKIVKNFVKMNLYHCGSCGAEVVANDVEASKVCSFCGQTAIVYDRVTNVNRPDLIIPFKLSKDQALESIITKYKKAKCLPKEFQNLSVDSIYPIYIPYYIFNAKLSAAGHIHLSINKKIVTKNFSGEEERYVFLDSSRKFNDFVSIYLNPFPYDQAVKFEPTYLSGFYADISDVESDQLESKVKNYLWDIISEKFMLQVPELRNKEQREQSRDAYMQMKRLGVYSNFDEPFYEMIMDHQEYELKNTESALCPVYFVTFNTPQGLANILVNGATGKVVGSIPADEELVKKSLTRNCAIFATILAVIFGFAFMFTPIFWIGGIAAILTFSFVMAGIKTKKKYEEIKQEMNTTSMFSLRRR